MHRHQNTACKMPLYLVKHDAMKYGGVKVKVHVFKTSVLHDSVQLYLSGRWVRVWTLWPKERLHLSGGGPRRVNGATNKFHAPSASQEIPRLLWNPKVHYRPHKKTPMFPILKLIHIIHTLQPNFPKIHFNIILTPTPKFLCCLFPSGFPAKTVHPFPVAPMQLQRYRIKSSSTGLS
jgi:hypothetical protein